VTAAGIFPPADLARLRALLRRLDLPTAPPCSFANARAALAVDKKTAARVVHCAIPTRIGLTEPVTRTPTAAWVRPVALALLEAAWEAACSA
jgi:3-dehydroquinate synthetase